MTNKLEIMDRELAIQLFNETWDLIDNQNRMSDEDSQMLEKAYASLYHWRKVGTPLNLARGSWQISRVHALLGHGDSSLMMAKQSLSICEEHGYADFDLAFASEAIARAYAVKKQFEHSSEWIQKAQKDAEGIEKEEDRTYFLSELETVPVK
jgi:hypothetical protein